MVQLINAILCLKYKRSKNMNEYELISPRLEDKEELLKMIEEIKI